MTSNKVIDTPQWHNRADYSLNLFLSFCSEFMGTLLVVFIITLGLNQITYYMIQGDAGLALNPISYNIFRSLLVTFAYTAVTFLFQDISFAQFNPAISIGAWMIRGISGKRLLMYWVAQIAGGCTGSSIVYGIIPPLDRSNTTVPIQDQLGLTQVNMHYGYGVATGVELLISFVLGMVYFKAILLPQNGYKGKFNKMGPLMVGLTYGMMQFVATSISGGSMNPAFSFGPAALSGFFTYQWVYWVGPGVGIIISVLVLVVFYVLVGQEHWYVTVWIRKIQDLPSKITPEKEDIEAQKMVMENPTPYKTTTGARGALSVLEEGENEKNK